MIHIRNATRDDVPRIVEIYNHAVLHTTATADEEPRTVEDRLKWFDDRVLMGYPVIVAEENAGGLVIGWGSLSPFHTRFAYRRTVENSVYVNAESRGKGAGGAILAELIVRAEQLGMHAIVAAIAGGNESSERLHARYGFVEHGRLPQLMWKFEGWIDLVYMVRLLG